ncbi:hypothetical protein D3C78_1814910 [compost metagenome]
MFDRVLELWVRVGKGCLQGRGLLAEPADCLGVVFGEITGQFLADLFQVLQVDGLGVWLAALSEEPLQVAQQGR